MNVKTVETEKYVQETLLLESYAQGAEKVIASRIVIMFDVPREQAEQIARMTIRDMLAEDLMVVRAQKVSVVAENKTAQGSYGNASLLRIITTPLAGSTGERTL